jgi:thymidylate synthase (FAD)
MKVDLINYTEDGINRIAWLARATRKHELDISDKDYNNNEKFVKALLKVKHLGILEHITFTFHVLDCSRILSHQLVRHRMASYLQQSDRHVKPINGNYVIPDSMDNTYYGELKSKEQIYIETLDKCYQSYMTLIDRGVPVEDARYLLPPAFFTHITITLNARSLLHFLELRLDKSAQAEIRELACSIFDLVYPIYPIIFESVKELRDKNGL